MSGPRRTARAAVNGILASILLAGILDLALSAAHGYPLVRPMWPLPPPVLPTAVVVTIELGVLAIFVACAWMGLRALAAALGRDNALARAPRFRVLAAAGAPLLLWRVVTGFETGALTFAGFYALGLAALFALDTRREGPSAEPGTRAMTSFAGVFGLTLAAALGIPALELARVPREEPQVSSSSEGPNLLLIVLDTVRADHLRSYGYERDTMPFLTGLAERATLFEHAVAASSYTLPSHASLFTGLLPESHGARIVEGGTSLDALGIVADGTPVAPLAADATTLAELARGHGLATAAVGANLAYLSPAFGLDQGFDAYLVPMRGWSSWQPAGLAIGRNLAERLLPAGAVAWYRSRVTGQGRFYLLASEVNALALRWLEGHREQRFLLFLNYMDAHAPYLPAPGYREAYAQADAPQYAHRRDRADKGDRSALGSRRRELTRAEQGPLVDAYDAELRYLDDRLAELFGQLGSWGVLARTVVVIVGDHGESFGEHGELEHASGLHEHQLHVPLLVMRPGQRGAERVSRTVHHADVLPTVGELLALDLPVDLDGTSLFADARENPVVAHLGPYGGIRSRDAVYRTPHKLIVEDGGGAELYDLAADPREARNLAAEQPALVRDLAADLAREKRRAEPRFGGEPALLDEATRERLRALGYER